MIRFPFLRPGIKAKKMNDEEKFQYAIKVILSHEGKYSNDPKDPGGSTNFGITQRFLDDIIKEPSFDKRYVKDLTEQDAIAIYRDFFWNKYQYAMIEALQIATKVFDMAVNMGPKQAHILLQRAINLMLNIRLRIKEDGIIGIHTIAAINNLNDEYFHEELRCICKKFYYNLVKEKPELSKFIDGWIARASW